MHHIYMDAPYPFRFQLVFLENDSCNYRNVEIETNKPLEKNLDRIFVLFNCFNRNNHANFWPQTQRSIWAFLHPSF